MTRRDRNSAIAAAVILIGFGLVAYFMPTVMLTLGEASPVAAGVVAVLFVAAFFLIFWLRAHSRGGEDR
jgi:hypothetical protein